MTMVKLCSFAPGQNLAPLRQQLDDRGLEYQVREADGVAELWVEDHQLDKAANVLDQLRRKGPLGVRGSRRRLLAATATTWPVTLVTVAMGIVGFLVVSLQPAWAAYFTFTELKMFISYMAFHSFAETYWIDHQWWRLITPAFLHFGVWHLLFNSLAMWELGRRLEFVLPMGWYAGVLLLSGIAANLMQFWISGADIFGGLSGVVFGLFGAIALLHKRTDSPILNLPRGLYVLALVSLVILPFVLEKTFAIHVANGAHFGGLLAGLVLGLLIPVARVRKVNLPSPAPAP